MITVKKSYRIKSSSALSDIFIESYAPDKNTEIKGIVQIAHGMAEHHERYEPFIKVLNENGFVVFINDHLGHGKSVAHNNELGFFGNENGYMNLVNDMKLVTDLAKKEYPDLPFVLFGHSMGSFLARYYTELFGNELSAVIYCGTAGKNPAAPIAVFIADLISKLMGTHYHSKFINKLAFGAYNKKIKPAKTDFDWLTTDNNVVDEYIKDKYCGFLFTATGYRDLFNMLSVVNRKEWYNCVPVELPIFITAGKDDPVGAYGKGINEIYEKLIKSGHNKTLMKLYDGDRHEILNEKDRTVVMNDIIDWIDGNI